MSTPFLRKEDAKKDWVIIDATDVTLGRLAAFTAKRLLGKHKPTYTPHTDGGDNVVVINAEKVRVTGKKLEQNKLFWHTGYPGGIKERTWGETLAGKHPERLVQKAVERMMPRKSVLGRKQISCLRVYIGSEHPHAPQNPKVIDFASLNPKNKRPSGN